MSLCCQIWRMFHSVHLRNETERTLTIITPSLFRRIIEAEQLNNQKREDQFMNTRYQMDEITIALGNARMKKEREREKDCLWRSVGKLIIHYFIITNIENHVTANKIS